MRRKPAFYTWENKGADQLCCNRAAIQHLCFRYTDSTVQYNFKPLAICSGCTDRFVSEIPKTGFLVMRLIWLLVNHMSRVMRKPDFCLYENKDADQLRGDREADHRLCFRYTDSTISLLSESEISSL